MHKKYLAWATLILAVLFIGWLIAHNLSSEVATAAQETATFRAWFWEHRTLDLLAQVGLIFAGALGVTALLPGHRGIREMRARPHKTHTPNEEDYAPLD